MGGNVRPHKEVIDNVEELSRLRVLEHHVRLNKNFYDYLNLWTFFRKLIFLKFFIYFFGELECVGHSFAYVAYFVILGDVWI